MGQGSGPGADQQAIGVAVVVAGELDDLVAPGEGPGQPNGAHAGLGARVDQPQRLNAGYCASDEPRQFHFLFHRSSKAGPTPGSSFKNSYDCRVGVAQHQRTPGAEVVDVLVSVYVHDTGAASGGDERRRAGDGAEGPYRAVHATGHEALGFGEQGFGLGELHGNSSC